MPKIDTREFSADDHCFGEVTEGCIGIAAISLYNFPKCTLLRGPY